MTTRRKLVVKGRGPDGHVIFYLEVYRGKLLLTFFDSPFTIEALLFPSQGDRLAELIKRSAEEARGHEESTES